MTSPRTLPEHSHKFETLDALRGIAALIVVSFHLPNLFGRVYFTHGYLAVDLFFILSGFVISFAYQRRLDEDLSTKTFLKARLIRLYPLYLAGLFMGFIYVIIWQPLRHMPGGWFGPVLLLIPSLLYLPIPGKPSDNVHYAFRFDYPAWSLFLELVANIFHALLLRRRRTKDLIFPLALSAAAVVPFTLLRGSLNYGVHGGETGFAIPRVLATYITGMLLFRFWHRKARAWKVWPGISALLLIAILAAPSPDRFGGLLDLAIDFTILPAIVILAACSHPSKRIKPVFQVLGTTSYAIYVFHVPLGGLFTVVCAKALGDSFVHATPWTGIIFLLLLVPFSICVDHLYDIPVRHKLRKSLRV